MKSIRKKWQNLFFLMTGITLLISCSPTPDFTYSDGENGYFKDFAGKWLVINYWADWCHPCIKEIPEINTFAAANPQLHVVGINYDVIPLDKEQAVIKQLNIKYPVARAQLHKHFGYDMPTSLPTTIIISPEGKVTKILAGPQTVQTLSENIGKK